MKKPQNKIAPLAGKGEVKKPRSHFNSPEAQRQRLYVLRPESGVNRG